MFLPFASVQRMARFHLLRRSAVRRLCSEEPTADPTRPCRSMVGTFLCNSLVRCYISVDATDLVRAYNNEADRSLCHLEPYHVSRSMGSDECTRPNAADCRSCKPFWLQRHAGGQNTQASREFRLTLPRPSDTDIRNDFTDPSTCTNLALYDSIDSHGKKDSHHSWRVPCWFGLAPARNVIQDITLNSVPLSHGAGRPAPPRGLHAAPYKPQINHRTPRPMSWKTTCG